MGYGFFGGGFLAYPELLLEKSSGLRSVIVEIQVLSITFTITLFYSDIPIIQ